MSEGQTATASEAADSGTSAADTSDAATTDSTATQDTGSADAAAPSESKSTGDTLVTGSDVATGDEGSATEPASEAAETTTADAATDDAGKADDASDASAEADDAAKSDGEAEGEGEKSEGDNLEGLPEDFDWRNLATDEKSRNRLNQFESMDDLAKFIRDADSLRRRAVVPPNSKSTPEEVAKFHKAIGVPETPDGYEIEMSPDATDADKERVDRLRMAAHGVHVTPDQLAAMVQWHQAETEAIEAREAEAFEQSLAEAKTELSRAWGPDFQKNIGLAIKTMKRGGSDQFAEDWANLELKDGSKIGNHPWTSQIFAKLGRQFGEAGIPGEVMPSDWAPSENELGNWMQEPGYINGTDKVLIAKVEEGFKRLYPS